MNDDRRFQENKAAFLELLQLGCPSPVIENYLGISNATAYKYLIKAKESHKWTENLVSPNLAKPNMLKLYSKIYAYRARNILQETRSVLNREKLTTVLEKFLNIEVIESATTSASRHFKPMTQFSFAADVPKSYQDLLKDLENFDDDHYYELLWVNFLTELKEGKTLKFNPCDLKHRWTATIIDQVLKEAGAETKRKIAPEFSLKLCQQVNDILLRGVHDKAKEVIIRFYGLDGEPGERNLKVLGALFSLSHEGARLIKKKTLRAMRGNLKLILAIPLNWDNIINIMESRLKEQAEGYDELIKCYGKTRPEEPRHRIKDLALSVRTKNCLKAYDVEFLEELAEYTRTDLSRFRNLGKISIREIEAALASLGISIKS